MLQASRCSEKVICIAFLVPTQQLVQVLCVVVPGLDVLSVEVCAVVLFFIRAFSRKLLMCWLLLLAWALVAILFDIFLIFVEKVLSQFDELRLSTIEILCAADGLLRFSWLRSSTSVAALLRVAGPG